MHSSSHAAPLANNETPLSGAGAPAVSPPPVSGTGRPLPDYVPSGFPGSSSGGGGFAAHANASHVSAGGAAGPSHGEPSGIGAPPLLPHADSAEAAEWRALYGASADMMAATARAFRAGSAGVSFMTPIFHLTAHDTTVLSMEHNNHCKLLGIATSRNEILVTWTQLMPVIENMGALRVPEDDLFGGEQAPPVDERLLEWDPATMSILIDELPYTCTELSWAPWQHGIYLAGLCPGHGVRIYRYSHGHWALDDSIGTTDSTSCAISAHFTVACACSRGRVELWVRGAAGGGGGGAVGGPAAGAPSASGSGAGGGGGGGVHSATGSTNGSIGPSNSAWVLCRTLTLPVGEDEDGVGASGTGVRSGGANTSAAVTAVTATAAAGRHRQRDILGVSWDESGTLLAVGDKSGNVHVVLATHDSTRLADVVFHQPPISNMGACKQVAWAPSSGRSFLSLAMVFSNGVRLVLFCRPRFMNAAGLPHSAHSGRAGGAAGHGAAGGSGGGASAPQLQVLASDQVSCEEVAKLSWNGTGTRFVTAHMDSSVNIWAADVRYQYQLPTMKGEAGANHNTGSNEVSPSNVSDGNRSGGHTPSAEKRLSLVVSLRRTSSVHPYHAMSK